MPAQPADSIVYFLSGPAGRKQFSVPLDGPVWGTGDTLPAWTALEFHRCPNCPLEAAAAAVCPLSASLAALVAFANEMVSYDEIEVVVCTRQRTISCKTTAQRAIGSLMGLLSALSGCPRTAPFRPMARFHLPFADADETLFRVAGMYLLAQQMRAMEGMASAPEEGLQGLAVLYNEVEVVNAAIAGRLRAAVSTDASVNALILLDTFSKDVPLSIEEQLSSLRPCFAGWLDPKSTH
jgi:hypothetical protein